MRIFLKSSLCFAHALINDLRARFRVAVFSEHQKSVVLAVVCTPPERITLNDYLVRAWLWNPWLWLGLVCITLPTPEPFVLWLLRSIMLSFTKVYSPGPRWLFSAVSPQTENFMIKQIPLLIRDNFCQNAVTVTDGTLQFMLPTCWAGLALALVSAQPEDLIAALLVSLGGITAASVAWFFLRALASVLLGPNNCFLPSRE